MRTFTKKYKFWIVSAVVLITLILVIPYIINKAMYLPIRTDSTSDADWLAFWGSFLGGVFGGFATLIGVRYTIKENEKSKKDEDKKKKPFIVPLKNTILVYRDIENNICYLSNKSKNENFFSYELIYFDLINLGKEHAFNVSLDWNAPNINEVETYLQENHIENKFKRGFDLICDSKAEIREDAIQIIKSFNNENIQSTYLFVGWRTLITTLIECIALNNENSKDDNTYNNIPLGSLSLNYKNIHGQEVNHKYLINGKLFTGYKEVNMESYYMSLEFNLDNKDK